ncbi:MAG: hypothetical protein LBK47_05345 [Prevotellaceae bacterium]|nr:hypothetical protein [Prevotellaceae bacterium]
MAVIFSILTKLADFLPEEEKGRIWGKNEPSLILGLKALLKLKKRLWQKN